MVDGVPAGETLRLAGIEDLKAFSRGGFATVYRGWQPAFQRWVAVKILYRADGPARSQFQAEIRALGRLSDHVHVVPVFDAGVVAGRPYLVMPFLSGGSLNDRLRRAPLGLDQALTAGLAVTDALVEAHGLGILHRDVKPANVLFTAYEVAQLADFGLAGVIERAGSSGPGAATVPYAAPEVLGGEPASILSDIYSVGATLYAALTGRAPFLAEEAESPTGQVRRAIRLEPVPLEHYGVPAPVAAVVSRAMTKDPGARYQSAAELRSALNELHSGRSWSRTGSGPDQPAPSVSRSFVAPPPPPPPDAPLSPPVGAAIPRSGAKRDGSLPGLSRLRTTFAGRHPIAAAAAAICLIGAGATAAGLAIPSAPKHRGVVKTLPRTGAASPTPTTQAVTPPTSAGTSSPTTPAPQPSSPPAAAGAPTAAQIPPATLDATLRSYYSLVNQHHLDQAWTWLSPSFQSRIGQTYYQQFWNSVRSVEVLAVNAANGSAQITLRYDSVSGNTSVETSPLSFQVSDGHILIAPGQ